MALGPKVTLVFDSDTRGLNRGAGKAITTLGKFATKSALVGGIAGGAAQSVAGLGVALAQASGAGLVLPAVLSAGAVAMGTLKVATAGFGDAMKEVMSADPEKFNEAIKELSPNARSTAQAIRDMRPELKGLKDQVQDRFFAGFSTDVKELGQKYLPILSTGMGGTATGLNGIAREALAAVNNTSAMKSVTGIFRGTNGMLTNMKGSLGNIVTGFITLATAGSQYLPGLGKGIDGLTEKFSTWAAKITSNGQFDTWVQNGLTALSQLRELAGNIGEIFGGVWRAAGAGGGGFLTTVLTITQSISNMVNSVQGQEALTTFFTTLRTLAGYLAQGLELIKPHLPAIAAAFGTIATTAGGTLLAALTAIAPHLSTIAGIVQFLAPALVPLAMAIGVLSKFINVWKVAQLALNLAMRMNPLGIVITLIGLLVGALIYAWNNSETFRNIVLGVWEAVKNGIQTAVDRISGIIQWFGELPMMIRNWFEAMKRNAIQKAMELVGWIRGLPGQIMSAIGNLGTLLWNAGRDLLKGLWDGISGTIGWLRDQIGRVFGNLLPQWVKNMLGIASPSKVFADIGKWIPSGMAIGIEANTDSVKKATAGLRDAAMIGATSGGSNFQVPPSSSVNGSPSRIELHITGNSRDILSVLIMEMQRTGKLQLRAV